MASFSDTAFSTSGFSDAAFDIGTEAATGSKGWPGEYRKHRERDFSEELSAKHRLREQIRAALEGPVEVSQAVEEAISEYVRPQKTDSRYMPLDARIDWDRIYRNLAQVEATVLMHIAWASEEDDDEDLLLLNG